VNSTRSSSTNCIWDLYSDDLKPIQFPPPPPRMARRIDIRDVFRLRQAIQDLDPLISFHRLSMHVHPETYRDFLCCPQFVVRYPSTETISALFLAGEFFGIKVYIYPNWCCDGSRHRSTPYRPTK
jgi:hypothetical protein